MFILVENVGRRRKMSIVDPLKHEIWRRFVREGVLDHGRMNKRIEESWYICRRQNVDPYDGKGRIVLDSQLLTERRKKNQRLLQIAAPILGHLEKVFQETKSILLLADSNGYVLYMNGHKQAMNKAEAIKFIEGVKWTEDEVGTNAIGTTLRIREPITVTGLEHYSLASQQWVCSATPIYDEKKELVGIIDLSYPIDCSQFSNHALATVVAAAYTIEQQFHMRKKDDMLELLKYSSKVKNPHFPSMICDDQGKIVWINHCLRSFFASMMDQPLEEICDKNWRIKTKTPIFSSIYHDLIGYEVTLQKTNYHEAFPFPTTIYHFEGVVGKSLSFQNLLKICEKVAKTESTVCIMGETGTGKELIARSIHQNSVRKNKPFVAVNCGAIPKELIGSELFGYVDGAFTGAKRTGHKGKFVQADGGTIFLDEIGEIPSEMQVALLRVLQEKEVVPIGGEKPVPVDIRVITATHRNLYKLVKEGKLREDLFYRIYVCTLNVPPLRERKEDIPFFIEYYCQKNDWLISFPDDVIQLFSAYHWPGNIRELFNVLERIRVEYGDRIPSISHLKSMLIAWEQEQENSETFHKGNLSYRDQLERERILNMLKKTNGNIGEAAAALNISRSTLYRKLKKYKLS